jgi:hypothetical protein
MLVTSKGTGASRPITYQVLHDDFGGFRFSCARLPRNDDALIDSFASSRDHVIVGCIGNGEEVRLRGCLHDTPVVLEALFV